MELGAGFQMFKQGAEARIYIGNYLGKPTLVKERFEKKYRHPILDANITKDRMKAEVRAIMRCKAAGIPTPAVYFVDLSRRCIFMEHVKGVAVKEYIEKLETELIKTKGKETLAIKSKLHQLGSEIGQMIGSLHTSNIIHGDLTSSNILICEKESQCEVEGYVGDTVKVNVDKSLYQNSMPNIVWQRLILIDFGLSKIESSPEDKGVDLYVLERAMLSTHPNIASTILFPAVVNGYTDSGGKGASDVLAKLCEVRMRGRKRTMVG